MTSKVPLLVLSLGTSGLLLLAASRLSLAFAHTSLILLAFVSLVPALVSLNIIIEGFGWDICAQVWKTVATFLTTNRQVGHGENDTPAQAIAAARGELLKAFNEHWAYHGRSRGLSRQRSEILSSSTSGSSLYDQVKGNLQDHVFSQDALVYFMDATTGYFLQATHHRRLVFTSKPTTSCLFHVEKGKTHHWGFRLAATQRYIGQNLVQKMVVTSRKLQAWESFRVLQRPEDKGTGACSPPIYLILSAARFGKGMWVAQSVSSFAQSTTVSINRSTSSSLDTEDESVSDSTRRNRRCVLLSKQFDHAIKFVYSSDLSALLAAGTHATSSLVSRPLTRAQTAPHLMGELLQVKGATFQVPKLTKWSGTDRNQLPWLDATAETSEFLETNEKDMTELMTTTIRGSSVENFLEIVAPRATRLKCRNDQSSLSQSAPVPTSASAGSNSNLNEEKRTRDDDLLGDWHAHPRFGLVRTLSYRTDAEALFNYPASDHSKTNSRARDNIKAVTVEQFHSCVVHDEQLKKDEATKEQQRPHQAALRVKIYTLSIPYSNCFSVEVLVEVDDVVVVEEEDRTIIPQVSNVDPTPSALRIRWRAAIVFSRPTMLQEQIERGALDGLRRSCSSIIELLQGKNLKREAMLRGTDVPPSSNTTMSCFHDTQQDRQRVKPHLLAVLPRAFALDFVKGLIAAVSESNALFVHFSNLPMQLPWRPVRDKSRSDLLAVPHAAIATTAYSFFKSAPEDFAQVLEENMGTKITAPLFFEALLSDATSLFRRVSAENGNREVDITAWRGILSPRQSCERTQGYLRKQMFQMPVHGVPGVDVVQVEDFEYYSLMTIRNDGLVDQSGTLGTENGRKQRRGSFSHSVKESHGAKRREKKRPRSGASKDAKAFKAKPQRMKSKRLEFGMKLFVPALPEGSQFSIEVLVIVEPAMKDPSEHLLRILFALPARHHQSETRGHAAVNPHVVAGVLRGLKQIWKQVAQTMVEIGEVNSDYVLIPHQRSKRERLNEEERSLLLVARAHPKLPTHDELASRLIESIAAVY